MKKRVYLFVVLLTCLLSVRAVYAQSFEERVAAIGADVIFVRHALAPGFGDPDNFEIERCSTQRNLNDEGRRQAKALGEQIAGSGVAVDRVLSSKWCRCLDTADLLNLSDVVPFDGLNSFFQGYVDRDKTLETLMAYLEQKPADQIDLMVSHQVVIRAVTGISPPSGGIVLYNSKNNSAERWSFEQ